MANNNTYVSYEEDIKGVYTYSQMRELYKEEVNKEKYATFEDWLFDMLKSGVFEEWEDNNSQGIILKHGESYLITYHNMNNKTVLATFLEEVNGMYLFKNINGEFAVTIKKVTNKEISIELIED